MKLTIKNDELQALNGSNTTEFPKYTSQLINWANQNAQGTRPRVVGQLSDLFPEFERQSNEISIEKWKEWYLDKYPNAIDVATEKIYNQVENLREALPKITKEMVNAWVKDLVITKTYNGLYVQKAILAKISAETNLPYRLSSPQEESKGIDGFVGNTAYSIKPDTYKTMDRLSESINVKMVYYKKTKTALIIEVED